jgi:hypothetical protein
MELANIRAIVDGATAHSSGRFYGAIQSNAPIGVGQLYSSVRCPAFNIEDMVFDTVETLVYVLTHECDIDQSNDRSFNKHLVICPLIPLEHAVDELSQELSDEHLKSFFSELARDRISRLVYFPPIQQVLSNGGLLYLNQLSHTHLDSMSLPNVSPAGCVSSYGLQKVDYILSNHLLRPKASPLPFQFERH